MSRKPIGERAMTDAERQRRRRQRLREQHPNRDSHDIPQSDRAHIRMLEELLRQARERQQQLEEELREAQQDRAQPRSDLVIAAEIYRFVRAALHPDRVTDPAAKEYLQTRFVQFSDLVEQMNKAAGGDWGISVEELLRRRAETHRKNRERAQRSAATRKAKKAAAQAAE